MAPKSFRSSLATAPSLPTVGQSQAGYRSSRCLALLVTELDVDDTGGPIDTAARDRGVADETRRFLDVVLDAPNLQAVLTWGMTDRYLDPPDEWKLKLLRWKHRKTPYDDKMARKPMWNALASSFAGRKVYY